jgi:hypothetical protein
MNLLYPKIVGQRVHLNPLVVAVALMFWSVPWGAAGLILAISDYRRPQSRLRPRENLRAVRPAAGGLIHSALVAGSNSARRHRAPQPGPVAGGFARAVVAFTEPRAVKSNKLIDHAAVCQTAGTATFSRESYCEAAFSRTSGRSDSGTCR